MTSLQSTLQYYSGYLTGLRTSAPFPTSLSQLSALAISKTTSIVSLPLPFLSFFALPFFGGASTTVNIALFALIWSSFVLSHDPLNVEIVGTLLVRLTCYLLPALAMLGFDCAVPNIAKSLKARGESAIPLRLGRDKLLAIALVTTGNTLLSVALQAVLEILWTDVFHLSSILKIAKAPPLPWNLFTSLLQAFVLRGILHYGIHRYLLHTNNSPLRSWHGDWQHSVHVPFSLLAAYDHPLPYLLANWLPTFLPAYLLRLHVLTWLSFLALTSFEDLFIYSGYAVLPSSIMLAGMARRTDAHFLSVAEESEVGNFGHWGIFDFVFRTTCAGPANVVSDVAKEVSNHDIQERVEAAVKAALAGAQDGGEEGAKRGRREANHSPGAEDEDDDDPSPGNEEHDELQASAGGQHPANDDGEIEDVAPKVGPRQRRSGRNKTLPVRA